MMNTMLLALSLGLATAALPTAPAEIALQPALAAGAPTPAAPRLQATVPGLSASCIRSYYNPQMYNWYSFQNNCGQAVHLVWIANNPSDSFGPSGGDLGAGQSTSTGWSVSEIQQKQGLSIFVCPAGYIPVDPNSHQMVHSATQGFVCQQ
jgi:hypothetical protein